MGFALLAAALMMGASKDAPAPPADDQLPGLAASLAGRLADRSLRAPTGGEVKVGTILDAGRTTSCLKTISGGGGWPASWLIVSDMELPYDLVLRVALAADGSIADPETIFLTPRREWDDDTFDAAFKDATGKKAPREKQRNVVQQSFTKKIVTDYVYELPKTGAGAKGLLAQLPEGSLIREASAIDLGDGKRHTLSIVLNKPHFVPADCATPEGKKNGHRDSGGISVVLAGESDLEDSLDITAIVISATGQSMLPRFTCEPGDTEPGTIEALVDTRYEGRQSVRLMDLSGRKAETMLGGLPVVVGIKKESGKFRVFARSGSL